MISSRKISDTEKNTNNVKSVQGSRLSGTVPENKNVFDKLCEFLITKYNGLIDDLSSPADGDSGADNIGATAIRVGGAVTDQGQHEELQENKLEVIQNLVTGTDISDEDYIPIRDISALANMKIALATIKEYLNYHQHDNKAVLDDITDLMLSAMTAMENVDGVISEITETRTTKIPNEAAIVNFVTEMGHGDMKRMIYDPEHNGYVDAAGELRKNGKTAALPNMSANDVLLLAGDVVNNLTSTDTDKPLSAAQGKALNDGKADKAKFDLNRTATHCTVTITDADGNAVTDGTDKLTFGGEYTLTATADSGYNFDAEGAVLTVNGSTVSSGDTFVCLGNTVIVATAAASLVQLQNYTMLYDSGYKNVDWSDSINSGVTITDGGSSVTVNAPSNAAHYGAYTTEETVDASGYTKCAIIASNALYGVNNSAGGVPVMFLSSRTSLTNRVIVAPPYPHTGAYVYIGDASDVNGKYIGIVANSYPGYEAIFTMTGCVLLKADDWQTLCTIAGVTAPADLATLLANSTSMAAIMASEAAVEWMVKQCTGDFMVGCLNSATGKAAVKASSNLNMIIANPHWAKFIMMIAPDILNYTMLYDSGDECIETTGGYAVLPNGASGIYRNDIDGGYIEHTAGGWTYGYQTNNSINMSGYKLFAGVFSCNYNQFNHGMSYSLTSNHPTSGEPTVVYQLTPNVDGYVVNTKRYTSIDTDSTASLYCFLGAYQASGKVYFGALFKSDDWQTLCTIAGITAPADLATLVANSTSMSTILNDEDAVKYLMGCTGDLMVTICNSASAMAILCDSIAYDYAFNHPIWYKFMTMIPTSLAAMDAVATKVPTMTSNTTPSGVASASSSNVYTNQNYHSDPYRAFDNINDYATSHWLSLYPDGSSAWLNYDFERSVTIYKAEYALAGGSSGTVTQTFKLQGSFDGVTFADISVPITQTYTAPDGISDEFSFTLESPATLRILRAQFISCTYNAGFGMLQVYGKEVTE